MRSVFSDVLVRSAKSVRSVPIGVEAGTLREKAGVISIWYTPDDRRGNYSLSPVIGFTKTCIFVSDSDPEDEERDLVAATMLEISSDAILLDGCDRCLQRSVERRSAMDFQCGKRWYVVQR